MSDTFGWDLLLDTLTPKITKKAEVLIVFVHWNLVRNNAKCLGYGEDKTLKAEEITQGSELLPENWNVEDGKYVYRYIFQDQLYILYSVDCGDLILFNWLNASKNSTSNIAMNIDSTVKALSGPLEDIIVDYREQIYNVNKSLLEASNSNVFKTQETQTEDYPLVQPKVNKPATTSTHQASPFHSPIIYRDLYPHNRLGENDIPFGFFRPEGHEDFM